MGSLECALIQYDCVLTKGKFEYRDTYTGRGPPEDDIATRQGRAKTASKPPEVRHEARNRFSQPRSNQFCQHFDLGLMNCRTMKQ